MLGFSMTWKTGTFCRLAWIGLAFTRLLAENTLFWLPRAIFLLNCSPSPEPASALFPTGRFTCWHCWLPDVDASVPALAATLASLDAGCVFS